MPEYPHDQIKPFADAQEKKQQISAMFDRIATRYDFMNRFLSVGIDTIWRKKAILQLKKYKPQIILDVATGTGDLAIEAAKMLRPKKIIGIDISMNMLAVGRQKVAKKRLEKVIELQSGDSETINFGDNTFDAVIVAFGVRNFENLEQGLKEIFRVLKRGGVLVVLEFSQPEIPGLKQLYNFYMSIVAPEVARWFHQNKQAYQYLNKSAKAFPDRHRFTAILQQMGYSDTSFKSLSLGICCIYTGKK